MDKIVIYCSASSLAPQEFNKCAASVVEGLCKKGYGIVSGGTVAAATTRAFSPAL